MARFGHIFVVLQLIPLYSYKQFYFVNCLLTKRPDNRKDWIVNANFGGFWRPRLVAGACLILLIPTTVAWLVNLELAIKIFAPSWKLLEVILPTSIFRICVLLSVDLSTVSTLVPVLLFLFPLIQAVRAGRGQLPASAPATGNEWMPYPPHFPYFLVMLGLFGTLYGLLIGLEVSGVEGFIAYRPTNDSISQSLTRLLAGAATAIWSSLLGLIGAFLAAQPVPWLFRRLIGVEQPPETVSLVNTIHALTMDLRGLAEASREFRNTLAPEAASGFLGKLDGIELNLRNLTSAMERTTSAIEKLAEERLQEREAIQQQTAELQAISAKVQPLEAIRDTGQKTLSRLESVQQGFEKTAELQARWGRHLEEANAAAHLSAATLQRIAGDLPGYALGIQQKLDGIAESNRDNLRLLREERDSFRRSLAAYMKQEETEKAPKKA